MTSSYERMGVDVRSPGWWLQVVGLGHGVVGLVLHRAALRDIVRRGVLGSVPDHGDRATAFWFLVQTPLAWTAGRLLRSAEAADDGPALRAAGGALVVAGAAGVVAMPLSPFWSLIAIGTAAARRGSSARRPAV